jgi:hypothetical protein
MTFEQFARYFIVFMNTGRTGPINQDHDYEIFNTDSPRRLWTINGDYPASAADARSLDAAQNLSKLRGEDILRMNNSIVFILITAMMTSWVLYGAVFSFFNLWAFVILFVYAALSGLLIKIVYEIDLSYTR